MRLKADRMIMAGLIMAGGLVGSVQAQDYLFRLEPVSARPGETAHVKVFVQSAQPVAALNFTVSAGLLGDGDSDENHIDGNITGDKADDISDETFAYVDNSPNPPSGKQYRGVLYGKTVGTTFPAGERHVATLHVPINAAAPAGAVIRLTLENNFDTDGITGLIGISNAAGESLVNSGTPSTARPAKEDGFVRVDPILTDVDFGLPTLVNGWRYNQGLPWDRSIVPAPGQDPTAPVGLTSITSADNIVTVTTSTNHGFFWGERLMLDIEPNDANVPDGIVQIHERTDNTFSFIRPGTPNFGATSVGGSASLRLAFGGQLTDDGVVMTLNFRNAYSYLDVPNTNPADFFNPGGADRLVVFGYDITSDGAHPSANPPLRLRSNATDFSWSQTANFQESPANSGPHVLPADGTGVKSLRAVVYAPESVVNGTSYFNGSEDVVLDGLTFSLDAVAADGGVLGTSVTANNFSVRSLNASELTGEQTIYSHNFATSGTDGFTALNSVLDTRDSEGNPTGTFTTTSPTTGGLNLIPNRYDFLAYRDANGQAVPGLYNFAFGWWEKQIDTFVIDSTKMYRVDFTIAATAADVTEAPNTRLRLTAGRTPEGDPTYAWVQEVTIETSSQDQSNFPTAEGKTYTAYFMAPPEVNGSPVLVSFDMFIGGGENDGGIIIKDLAIKSYDMPIVP